MRVKPPLKSLRSWAGFAGAFIILGVGFFFRHNPGATSLSLDSSETAALTRNPGTSPLNRGTGASGQSSHSLNQLCGDIYPIVCAKKEALRDPTGSVRSDLEGERMALHLYQEIVAQHPDWNSEQVDREFIDKVYTPKVRGRLESAYRWVRHSLIQFLDKQPASIFTSEEKRQLKQRLMKTKLDLPTHESPYPDEPDLLTKSDVFYEVLGSGQMRLRIGGAYPLSARSWFNIVFTMAHELAHSIDPCEVRYARLSYPAYDRLGACFLSQGLIAARKTRQECSHNDQLSETFADWMAVQVSAKALDHFATEFKGPQLLSAIINSVRDLCEEENEETEEDIALHPPAKVRINRIFGKSPQIRELLGCANVKESSEYCQF